MDDKKPLLMVEYYDYKSKRTIFGWRLFFCFCIAILKRWASERNLNSLQGIAHDYKAKSGDGSTQQRIRQLRDGMRDVIDVAGGT